MWRIYTLLRLLLLGLAGTWGLCLPGVSRAAEMTLEELIEAVRQNELLYGNIDVTLRQKYEQNPEIAQRMVGAHVQGPSDVQIKPTQFSEMVWRYVVQGELYRTEKTSRVMYVGENSSETFVEMAAYDGRTTRGRKDHIGNIVQGKYHFGTPVRVHGLFTLMGHEHAPLSVKLGGSAALRAYRSGLQRGGAGRFAEYGLVKYRGMETCDGLRCHVVWLIRQARSGGSSSGEALAHLAYWLAEERNFIPLRYESYQYDASKTIPVTKGRVLEWTEVTGGVWFPRRVVVEAIDIRSLQLSGQRVPNWRCEWLAEAVSLEPNHDISFFRDVPFPPGTIVYEVEGGEIKKGYQLGAPTAKAGGGGAPPGRRWWAYLLGAVIVVLGAAAIGVWRWRRTLKASAKA